MCLIIVHLSKYSVYFYLKRTVYTYSISVCLCTPYVSIYSVPYIHVYIPYVPIYSLFSLYITHMSHCSVLRVYTYVHICL